MKFSSQCIAGALAIFASTPCSFGYDNRGDASVERVQSSLADGDTTEPHHALYAEAGGSAIAYSLNYEFRPVKGFAARAGFSLLCFPKFSLSIDREQHNDPGWVAVPVVPAALYWRQGSGSHHLELGAGVTLALVDDNDARFLVPQAGYRYEAPSGGFLFRATFTPLLRMNDMTDVLPWGGVSAGASW